MKYSRMQKNKKERAKRKKRIRFLVFVNILLISFIAVIAAVWMNIDRLSDIADRERVPPASSPAATASSSAPNLDDSPPDGDVDEMPVPSEDATTAPETDPVQEEEEETITLALVGDILPASSVARYMEQHGYDYPYRESSFLLQAADITAGNLESAITDRGTPEENKEYTYRGSPLTIPAIREAGFDVLSLANNHTLDYGLVGLMDTMAALDEHQIKHMGAGNNEAEAFAPAYVEAKGFKVAFIGVSNVIWKVYWNATKTNPGLAETYNPARTLAAIEEAKKHADLVVVMVHWGVEYTDEPVPYQVKNGRAYIDAGADLVIGSHPHVLQGFESYNGKWIAYSLGNFVFSGTKSPKSAETGVLMAECRKDGQCQLQFHPMLAKAAQPVPMDEAAAKALFAHLSSVSTGATIEENGAIVEQS